MEWKNMGGEKNSSKITATLRGFHCQQNGTLIKKEKWSRHAEAFYYHFILTLTLGRATGNSWWRRYGGNLDRRLLLCVVTTLDLAVVCSADREWRFYSPPGEKMGPKKSHISLTLISPQAFIFGLIGAEEVTYFSDLWLCESARSFLNIHITGIHSRCTCLHVTDETRVQECATRGCDKLDWRCREDNDSLVVGSFPHNELDGEEKRPLRRREKKHQSSQFSWEMSKRSRIPTANESTLSVKWA